MAPEPSVATHTAPAAAARPLGSPPVLATLRMRPVTGSSRSTVPSRSATHRLPALARTSLGWPPRAMVCATVLVCGSIRDTVRSAGSSTHTCPPATVMRLGWVPTGMAAATVRRAGSTRTTRPAADSATHTEPDPATTAVGGARSGTVASSVPLLGETSVRRFPAGGTCALAWLTTSGIASAASAALAPNATTGHLAWWRRVDGAASGPGPAGTCSAVLAGGGPGLCGAAGCGRSRAVSWPRTAS